MKKKKNYKKYVITAEQLFDIQKPLWNGFATKAGPHKNKKAYDRKKAKKELRNLYDG